MPVAGIADLTGRVLASRYRLLAPIGAGSGGRVYVADDVRLRRRVAVKVLHPALAEDQAFLRRFRSEAQLAASLHHPNIMAVYDWGEDQVPFMILELLEGGSLRAMLDEHHKLSPAQATHIGQQVCQALEYAHDRGLVHRDIKPANLIFDEHGIVRVADFGLARALAEASWTEPTGAVVGTARYAAPEQAAGSVADPRSDLYSLALVLVESVTGEVPLVGDTPIGTIGMRSSGPIVAPKDLGALGSVVERAGRSDPSERYPDASTMGTALTDALLALPKPNPLVLAGMTNTGDDPHPTQVGEISKRELFDQDASVRVLADQPVEDAYYRRQHTVTQTRRSVGITVAVCAVLALLIAGWFIIPRPNNGKLVATPNVIGQSTQQATAQANAAGLDVRVNSKVSDDPKGFVISQSPKPGRWATSSGGMALLVSSGPTPVVIPAVDAKPLAVAQDALQKAGFIIKLQREYNETIPKDIVLRSKPASGKKFAPESIVTLTVSNGPAPVPVPDVTGKTFDQASAALNAVKLKVVRDDEFNSTIAVGVVVSTTPAPGASAPRDSSVSVVVSKGPELITVPNVVGLPVESAAQQLEAAGLVADVQNFASGKKVRAQDPPNGAKQPRGSKVTLFL